jgi:hypothetical protein
MPTRSAMQNNRDRIAALNNAEWCAAVWRSHGLSVGQAHGMWFCPHPTPTYFPNVVTIEPGAESAKQSALIAELARDASLDLSVKDSFACLDLAAASLQPLFDARWLWRRARSPIAEPALDWRRIDNEPGLGAWERAWRGADPEAQRIFRPKLLNDERVCVLAGFDGMGTIRAGGIAYSAAGVTGVTNIFGSRREFVDALEARTAPTEIVCYEHGGDLTSAVAAGFETLGSLRVWGRAA